MNSINYQGSVISKQVSDHLSSLSVVRSEDKLFLGSEPDGDMTISGLPTLVSICKAVVLKLLALDESNIGKDVINNDHWGRCKNYAVVPGATFPAHAIINVRRRDEADEVGEYLNNMFRADRGRFPTASGWKAIVTTGDSTPSLSDNDHPFFYYKNNGVMNSRAARILVVVDLATEGLNNRYISVWGCGTPTISRIDALQRLGRPVRTAAVFDHMRGTVAVPPASHDNLYVIAHEDYPSALANIVGAFHFMQNSTSVVSSAMTISDYVNADGDSIDDDNFDTTVMLGVWERFSIARKIGEAMRSGKRPSFQKIVADVLGKKVKPHRKRFATSWAESAYSGNPMHCHVGTTRKGDEVWQEANALDDLKSWLRNRPSDPLTNVLTGESIQFNAMNYDECKEWLQAQNGWGGVVLNSHINTPQDEFVGAINKLKMSTCGAVLGARMDTRITPASIIDKVIADLNGRLGHDSTKYVHECVISRFSSVRPSVVIDDFGIDQPLCDPNVTYEMRDEKFHTSIRDYVVFKMLDDGKLTDIAQVLRV